MKKFTTKGKSTAQLADLSLGEFSALTRRELAQVVSKMSATANKRLKGLRELDVESPAYKSAMKSGGKFSVRGKNINELRSEYMRVKNFLESKTSTKRGFYQVEKDFLQRIGRTEIDNDVRSKMWDVYNRIQESMQPFIQGSGDRQKFIYDVVEDNPYLSIEEIIDKVKAELTNDYEEEESTEDEIIGFLQVH